MTIGQVPKIWGRFVNRAARVKADREFQRDITQARAEWAGLHADVPLGPGSDPPVGGWTPPPTGVAPSVPYPERLEEFFARADLGDLTADSWFSCARRDWDRLIVMLAVKWFPSRYYPRWSGALDNPSFPFIAACLRWGYENVVPAKFVASGNWIIYRSAYNPHEPQSDPYRAEREVYISVLEAALREAVATGLIDQGWLDVTLNSAKTRAAAVKSAMFEHDVEYVFVQVLPGIGGDDWAELWQILQYRGLGPAAEDEWIAELLHQGLGNLTIAKRLGLPRTTVQSKPTRKPRRPRRPPSMPKY